ncbi:MAG: AraC family transcriptional regulator [Pseudomonadota bacterium]|nr:AraC family transcriptional regulator [Pseudomonadota bacterium]
MNTQISRSIYSVVQMIDVAAEHGLSATACLENSGIAPDQLHQLESQVYPQQECTVIANIVRGLPRVQGLGLRMAARFHMPVYGVLTFAMCSCATAGDAITLGLGYHELSFTLVEKHQAVVGDDLVFTFGDRHIPAPLRQIVVERDMFALSRVMDEVLSRQMPKRAVRFAFPPPPHARQYVELLGFEPEFNAPAHQIIVDAKFRSLPMPQANAATLRHCMAQLNAIMARRKNWSGTAGRVRDMLLRHPAMAPNMEAVAAELRMTSRNLRRMLEAENTSFRSLSDEVRQTLAEELLGLGKISVKDVATRLGYSEVSSFTNAFKRWTGRAPRDWRSVQ